MNSKNHSRTKIDVRQGDSLVLVSLKRVRLLLVFACVLGAKVYANDVVVKSVRSGDWHNVDTWQNGVKPSRNTPVIITAGTTVTFGGKKNKNLHRAYAKNIVVHGTLEVLDTPGQFRVRELTTDWMHVNGEGALFRVGKPSERYDDQFTLNLYGINLDEEKIIPVRGEQDITIRNDGFLMADKGGRFVLYGQDKLSYTKLAQNAVRGSKSITVENIIERNFSAGRLRPNGRFETTSTDDGHLNWQIGDRFVIASTSYDYKDFEVRTITGLQNNGNTTTLSFNEGLEKRHYGRIEKYDSGRDEIDMRAEVALLSRNIRIQGRADQDTDLAPGDRTKAIFMGRRDLSPLDGKSVVAEQVKNGIGGQVMIMAEAGKPIVVEGVQLDRLGQSSRRGRYPFHWHMAGNRAGDVLRNSTITNSNNRGVTVHATGNVLIEGVVLFDIHGHGFFIEDAVETGNKFIANLTIGIHPVGGDIDPDMPKLSDPFLRGAYAALNRGVGDVAANEDPFIVDTHDLVEIFESRGAGSAGFWITNPNNTFIGNINAGAFGTGFWYVLPRMPIGASAKMIQSNNFPNQKIARYLRACSEGYTPARAPTKFEYNSSHATPSGLAVFRGQDLESADNPIPPADPRPGAYLPSNGFMSIEGFSA